MMLGLKLPNILWPGQALMVAISWVPTSLTWQSYYDDTHYLFWNPEVSKSSTGLRTPALELPFKNGPKGMGRCSTNYWCMGSLGRMNILILSLFHYQICCPSPFYMCFLHTEMMWTNMYKWYEYGLYLHTIMGNTRYILAGSRCTDTQLFKKPYIRSGRDSAFTFSICVNV